MHSSSVICTKPGLFGFYRVLLDQAIVLLEAMVAEGNVTHLIG